MPMSVHDPKVFVDDLSRVIEASRVAQNARACLLTTRDREHALTLIKEAVVPGGNPLFHFTVAARRRYQPDKLVWEAMGQGNADPSALLACVSETKGGGIFVLEDCMPLLRDDGGDRNARMKLADMLCPDEVKEGLVMVFVEPPEAENHLPGMLADQIVRLDVPYPRAQELEVMAREEIAAVVHRVKVMMPVEKIKTSASMLAEGLVSYTRSAARDALRDALSKSPTDLEAAVSHLTQRKASKLSRELSMNVLNIEDTEDPIGLGDLVEYLEVHKDRMRTIGKNRARGILLIGPPGTGKTMLAKAVGKLVGLPVIEFRISSLMNSLLGATERRFAQAFATLEAMAPNVVFIDEIEKAFGDSSEQDGGTMMRCTGALLSWLSDNPYPNFIVATCNSLKRMGEIGLTMTRSGRFDAAYFVDVPNASARIQMLERWLEGRITDPKAAACTLAADTEKFSGADLHSLVKQAAAKAEHAGHSLTLDDLRAEAGRKRTRVLSLYDEFAELRRWGRIYCEPSSRDE